MKTFWLPSLWFFMAAAFCRASDHADPIDLGPMFSSFFKETDREAGITDLHVFYDSDQDPSLHGNATAVVISFCVGRSLPPLVVRDAKATKSIVIPAYPPEPPSNLLLPRIVVVPGERPGEPPKSTRPVSISPFTYRIYIDTDSRLRDDHPADNDRYGGTILEPVGVAEDITLEVKLKDDITIEELNFGGLLHYDQSKWRETVVYNAPYTPENRGKIHVRSGIFDDPFIFPRFFRTNVIGIVIQIPLRHFDEDRKNWLIWGATWKGKKQIDHVGRSQRTQLPRFDYLNTLHPSRHVAAINRVHEDPTIVEDFRRTLIGPLFARRHYDAVPDVMIFDRKKPTHFPNGRLLSDDVAALIAKTGDTQLFEISYADSMDYPRITVNDGEYEPGPDGKPVQIQLKPFRSTFPYLAAPWTAAEASAHPVSAPSRAALQDSTRANILWLAIGTLIGLVSLIGLAWWFGYRTGKFRHHPHVAQGFSAPQGISNEDSQPGATFAELHRAVIDTKTCRPYYGVWGSEDEKNKDLPRYEVSFWTVAKGILPLGIPWGLASATRRTLKSTADLRWGKNRTGFQRLIHPNGICLAGEWEITEETKYTGYFAKGKKGRVIARVSPSREETRRDHGWRSMGLVGKLYPVTSPNDNTEHEHAAFITQEDLGGIKNKHIQDSVFINAPDVSSWRRGKGFFSLALSGFIFARVNVNATIRQLHEIAELGEPKFAKTNCPTFMRLKIDKKLSPIRNEEIGLDVRQEILGLIYDKGDPEPKHKLVFDIEISDAPQETIKSKLMDAFIRRGIPESSWKKIGRLTFDEAACGYNGDFVIHFRHPKWRTDLNNSESASEVE